MGSGGNKRGRLAAPTPLKLEGRHTNFGTELCPGDATFLAVQFDGLPTSQPPYRVSLLLCLIFDRVEAERMSVINGTVEIWV